MGKSGPESEESSIVGPSKASSWASRSLDEVIQELDTDPARGITSDEAEERLRRFGENRLAEEEEEGFLDVLREEMAEPMILLLLVVGVLYSVWGGLFDALTIFTIIVVLVLVEVYNEYRSERSIEALKELTSPTVLVLRDGSPREISTTELVPGDILPLSFGERIPADARLVRSYGLQLDESSLTGESFPVPKEVEAIPPENAQISDLTNMVFAGTLITQGEGLAVVVSTGRNTELGRVAELTREAKEPKTPLQVAMKELSESLVWIAVFFSILIPAVGFLRGQPLITMVLTGLSLAFAVIPEELPIIITMVLAVGAYALSRQNALVKRLRAAETLGSVTVIATDKTGTITENRMSLGHLYFNGKLIKPSEGVEKRILEIALLSTGAVTGLEHEKTEHLDPMGAAVLDAAREAGLDLQGLQKSYTLRSEFSFDNTLKRASYIYQHGRSSIVFTSGASEAVIEKSAKYLRNGRTAPFTEEERKRVEEAVAEAASMGERTLALGYRRVTKADKSREEVESRLVFAGMVSFVDPPRPEVRDVIRRCNEAGIRVMMLTGDHPETAKSIAVQVGIGSEPKLLTGAQISAMDEGQLRDALESTSIFARITPEHKLRIVRLLKEMGEVVAVTGDGVNDAPALQEAAIGIAMGQHGTDAAREASDMILTDDNFVTIERAVREGRKIFDNLKKGVRYYLAVKVALVSIFILPLIVGIPLPFPPIQIILLELFMDLAASSGFVAERAEADIMRRPPRDPRERFMTGSMVSSTFVSALGLFAAVSANYLFTYFGTGDLIHAQTVAFSTWILAHIFLALNLRSERQPLVRLGLGSNRVMVAWALVAIAMLLSVTNVPTLQTALGTSNLTAFDWVLVLGVSFSATFWLEAVKWIRPRANL